LAADGYPPTPLTSTFPPYLDPGPAAVRGHV